MNRNLSFDDNAGNRLAIFVDVRDLYKNGKRVHKAKLDYSKFLEWVVGTNSIIYAGAYVMSEEGVSEDKFFDSLRLSGYDIRHKKAYIVEHEGEKHVKNSWNLGISLDMVKYADKADTLVLATCNSEFYETCNYLRSRVRVEVVGIREVVSDILKKSSTEFTVIPKDVFSIGGE